MIRINSSKWWRRPLLSALGAISICLTLSSIASAQLSDRKTIVTFSGPFEIPGSDPQVLPAGTYVFKVMDHFVDRNIVQVSNRQESHVLSLILAIPTRRDEVTDKTVMTFEERISGQPQALRKWFYPYENWGQEFVYTGHAERTLLAATITSTAAPILTAPEPRAEIIETTAALEAPANPEPIPVAVETATVVTEAPAAAEPTPAPVEETIAEAEEAPEPAPVQTASLPHTATFLPLLLLLGLASFGAAFSLRRFGGR